ncbi:MAG: heavy metal-associated domain-containing protein [Fuerstiella sp.]
MKNLMLALGLVLFVGCAESEVDSGAESGSTVGMEVPGNAAMLTSFAAGDETTLEIPSMSCQISCFPKIKETLEGMEGVEVVELVPQEDEVAINDHRITVKFDAEVSSEATMQVLADAGYDDAMVK